MAFDADKPAASTSLRSSNPEILANQSQLQTGVNNEHIFSGTSAGTQTGDHTQGSARVFFQDAAPATRIDGNGFLSTDLGSLWVDSNSSPDNQFNVLTATTPTWTPVSTEIIATLLASASLSFSANIEAGSFVADSIDQDDIQLANDSFLMGTAQVGGALSMIKHNTNDAVVLNTDNDAPAIMSKTVTPTGDNHIANKKYVDDNVGSANWTPTSYAGEESITFPNGLILKHGITGVVAQDTDVTVTFGSAFPTAVVSATAHPITTSEVDLYGHIKSATTSAITVHNNLGPGTMTFGWQVWGY